MKEVADSLAKLFAIIMLTVTFAISLAALSMWANSGAVATPAADEPAAAAVQVAAS